MEILSRSFIFTSFKSQALWVYFTFFILLFKTIPATAGPFFYGSEYEKYDRVHMDDPNFIGWASEVKHYEVGTNADERFQTPEKAIGKASGNDFYIVSLGRGGSITLTFYPPIKNGKGWDFAVFENAFNDYFLELAYVEVSSDGNTFVRFNNCSLTPSPVNGFGTIDATNITGLAGKYKKGYGTPFDLSDLMGKPEINSGRVDLKWISYVRIIDIVGDGTCYDDRNEAMKSQWGENSIIYDPYPTISSAGFDLDAVGVRYQNTSPKGSNNQPNPPVLLLPVNGEKGVSLTPTFITGSFDDPDHDIHIQTRWQISKDKDFSDSNLLFDVTSFVYLTSLILEAPILDNERDYYWRVKFYDTSLEESVWSGSYLFTTTDVNPDENQNGIPDDQELEKESYEDLNVDGIPDIDQMNSQYKCLKTVVGDGKSGIETSGQVEILESVDSNSIPYIHSKPDNFPLGLLRFRLKLGLSDNTNNIIYFSKSVPGEAKWYIYDLKEGCWKDYSENVSPIIDGKFLTLQLQDGGSGDMDVADGYISTIGGIGYFNKVIPPPDEEAGFGGMGSCFIETCLQRENPWTNFSIYTGIYN